MKAINDKPKLRPFKKFGPGYFIQEQMDERNWTQEDLSAVMGLTTKHINGVLQDKQPISLEIARKLSEIFETSAEYWINLDTNYRLWLMMDISPTANKTATKKMPST